MLSLGDSQIHTECASMSVNYIRIQFHMPCSNCSSVTTIKMKAKVNLYTTIMLLLFIVQKLHIFSMICVSRNRTPIYNTIIIGNKGLNLMAQFATSIKETSRSQAWWLSVFHFRLDADFSHMSFMTTSTSSGQFD